MIDYPAGAFNAATPGNINLRNAIAVPRTAGTGVYDFSSFAPGTGAAGPNSASAHCVAANAYHCQLIVNNAPKGRGFILRLRTRYVGTDYRVRFMTSNGGGGSQVDVPDGTATIDITAKAGSAYRRVIYKVPYSNGAASGLDYVIYGDQGICKDFNVLGGSVSTAGCPY
jgi:hypothetical protein